MAFLISEFFMTTFWKWVITDLFSFITNYAFRVVAVTVIIKLIMFPLDFYQRKNNRDNSEKMKRMKPDLDKINARYANDRQTQSVQTQALYKKHNYKMMGACLPLILTMFIFITLWQGYSGIAQAMNKATFDNLETTYDNTYEQTLQTDITNRTDEFRVYYIDKAVAEKKADKAYKDKTDAELKELAEAQYNQLEDLNEAVRVYIAQDAVYTQYEEKEKVSFIWIKSIWRPDVFWSNPIPSSQEYADLISSEPGKSIDGARYENVMGMIVYKYKDVSNGWLILVVLSVGLNFLSQFLMQRQQKGMEMPQAGGTGMAASMGQSMKMMMYIMPLMIGYFAISQSSAFTLYMVTNAAMTVLLNFLSTFIIKMMENRKKENEKLYRGRHS